MRRARRPGPERLLTRLPRAAAGGGAAGALGARVGPPLWVIVVVMLALAMGASPRPAAAAATAGEIELARTYAPVLALPAPFRDCDGAIPERPIDVALVLDNDEVALIGPWNDVFVVAVAPSAERIGAGLPGHSLDFPGDPVRPRCDYEEWTARLGAESPPTTYARVVTQEGKPGRLALQYWFFYPFNDFKNTHEGDWEMIQIVFAADDPAGALARGPSEVGYSQHEGAERAAWGARKLKVVDGTHPVVHPAAGSHANYYGEELYLGASRSGVGCDDTRDPAASVRPAVETVPTAPAAYLPEYPWLGFQGRWGERRPAFFNGPTGPNMKEQWTRPITWAESWKDDSVAVPGEGLLGTGATDLFCGALTAGSAVLRAALRAPERTLAVIGIVVALLVIGLRRARWRPSSPFRLARRRSFGQVLGAAWNAYRANLALFLRIGLVMLPIGLIATLLQAFVFRVTGLERLADETGGGSVAMWWLALLVGVLPGVIGLVLIQAATARALVAIDDGASPRARDVAREIAPRVGPLNLALLVLLAVQVLLDLTLVLIPLAVWLLVRWCLLGVVVGVEGRPFPGILRRSAALVTRNWWRTASLVIGVGGAIALIGPFVGVLVILLTGLDFALANLVAGAVSVATLPLSALVTTYLYFDLRVRAEVRVPAPARDEVLPAEI